ncbi:hypothetical protein [Pseudomonas viridiflava]|uniref:hypothetical protein n=1 Tax=Pseudomonas viridiflava TaxID=33069 RepID=UPI0018E5EE5D|nr:hypothetical protein [Pseudomonas viridiflava]MBI6575929.1 hypothetical protein [Pseudomonas viridiflava]MBI6606998.1 hypothetical protein [Pseudomonas viridiflava]MBI6638799.1 hypothetical protein [Pseudomonas viridiflava]MEE4068906.1 hypothetical protein [Pseudomonas viridiflava]
MKPSTLNTLLVAKSIIKETKHLVNSGNKHSCTAGIILLQDFVELIVLAVLDELDRDEQRNLESKSFDELLGELRKAQAPVIKSGTIKALNKQRVICKHYGQLTEPASVINYYTTAITFADTLLKHITNKSLQEIFLTQLLKDGLEKSLIETAINHAESGSFAEALLCLRKAFYTSYENNYCIYDYRDYEPASPSRNYMLDLNFSGSKADISVKNAEWIKKYVSTPVGYLQVNHEQIKTDCMELGVSTVDIESFRRLTPSVVQTEPDTWHYEYTTGYAANEFNDENFQYCLEIIIDFLLKKQRAADGAKWPKQEKAAVIPPVHIGKPVYEKPSTVSAIKNYVPENFLYNVNQILSGFDPNEKYIHVTLHPQSIHSAQILEQYIWGYILIDPNTEAS